MLLLHVTKIIDLWWAGSATMHGMQIIHRRTRPLKYYGVRKVRCVTKPLYHLALNRVFILSGVCFANCLTTGMRFGACLGVESSV